MTAFEMAWVVVKSDIEREIDIAINNGIFDMSDYNVENAERFQRFLRRKYNDETIEVEYVEDDEMYFIDIKGETYRFDNRGRLR